MTKISMITSLNPLQATHDPQLQKYIDAHPYQGLNDEGIAGLNKILALSSNTDVSTTMTTFGRLVRHLPRGITGCPVYTVEWSGEHLIYRDDLFYIDDFSDDISDQGYVVGNRDQVFQYAGYNSEHAIIGYDTEYVSTEREIAEDERSGEITISQKMVSYQWYFSLGIEHVAVVLVTDKRLTQNAFVRRFLANALPDNMVTYNADLAVNRIRKVPVKKVYAAAHFSLVDAGALLPSFDRIERIAPDGEDYSFEVPIIKTEEKEWKDRTWVRERRPVDSMVWVADKWISEASLKRKNSKRRSTKKLAKASQESPSPKIWVHCCDTTNLFSGSLAKMGDAISIKKLDPDGQIHQMDVLWKDNPKAFLLYAARDVIVTGQAILYYHRLFGPLVGGALYTRVPKYGEAHFKALLQQIYYRHATGEDIPISSRTGLPKRIKNAEWKKHLGYREKEFSAGNDDLTPYGWIRRLIKEPLEVYPQTITEYAQYLLAKRSDQGSPGKLALLIEGLESQYQTELSRTEKRLVPTPGIAAFLPFCYGGRTDARVVGPVGKGQYVDLKSAYPTSEMLPNDHSFLRALTTTGSEAQKRVEDLLEEGPFLIAGVYVSFIFKADVEPIFPVRVEGHKSNGERVETLIFPTSGASHVTWPEFYVAFNQGLLEKSIVHSVIEFERLETRYLADHVTQLMRLRKHDAHNMTKLTLNSSYGKTLQGLSDLRQDPCNIESLSAISCVPLGAYMTSVCRAVIGEIINRNNWYGIATDAVIVAGHGETKVGPVTQLIQEKLAELEYQFVERDFIFDKGFSFKRGGYLLFGQKIKDDVPTGIETVKMAPLGMRIRRTPDPVEPGRLGVEAIEDLVTGVTRGELRVQNWQTFSDLERQYRKQKERRAELQQKLKHNRNAQSKIRIMAGISYEQLKQSYQGKDISFRVFEQQKVQEFISTNSAKAKALSQLLEDYQELREEYEAVVARDIFPRLYFRTVRVNHSYDMKRTPIFDSIKPTRFVFSYGPSDGSTFEINHVSFDTRPVYSVDEYRQLVFAATRNMAPEQYAQMLADLSWHGVLSDYHDLDAFRSHREDTTEGDSGKR